MKSSAITCFLLLICFGSLQAQDSPFEDLALPALLDKRVQNELDLSEPQKSKLTKVFESVQEYRKEYTTEFRELVKSGLPPEEAAKKQKELRDAIELRKGEYQKDAFEVLLPHQIKRLRQLTVQAMMPQIAKQQNAKSGLLTKEMMTFLEIDEVQKNKILKRTEELQKELMEEMKKLQEKYVDKLLDELTPSQRKKYSDAVGEKVEGLARPANQKRKAQPANSPQDQQPNAKIRGQ